MTEPDACSCAGRGWSLTDARIVPCECGVYDPPKWVTRGDTACLIPHWRDPDRPRRASVGYVCGGHHARIERLIAELPALHDDLGLVLTTSEDPNHDRVQSSREPGLSLNRNVVEARDEIRAELVRMAREILEEQPTLPWPTDTVPALATWLVARLDWICSQPDVDDTHDNLTRLTSGCKRLAYPSGAHRVEIGPCGTEECPGVLWLRVSQDEGRTMTCDYCERGVEPRYWRAERRRIDGVDVNPWLTIELAALQYGVSIRTVQRWVAKGRLKTRGNPPRVRGSGIEALIHALKRLA